MESDKQTSTNGRRLKVKGLAAQLRQEILDKTPFEVDSHSEFGLYLVAKRDIKAGEILYEDKAVIAGPCANVPDVQYDTPLCLGCCLLMEEEKVRDNRCETCGWPICSVDCEGLENHTKNECLLFSEFGTTFPLPSPTGIVSCYAVIPVIRGLLLKDNYPDLWSLVMTLQHKTQLPYKPSLNIASIKSIYNIPPEFGSDDEWHRIHGVISVNNHATTLPLSQGSPQIRCGEALFPIYSLVANSCSPNCVWALKYDDIQTHSFTLAMYPAVDIKKGEMITASYISSLTKMGNHKRRKRYRERMNFQCKCLRCEDPTENGSYFDALKCFQCKDGYMLPMEENGGDRGNGGDAFWKCEICGYSVPLLFGCSLLELVFEKLLDAGKDATENGFTIIEQVELFMEANAGVYLHPNHCILAEAACVIVQLQMGRMEDFSKEGGLGVEELERYLELCEYLLKIGDKLAPGLSVERGMAGYYVARGLFRKLDIQVKITSGGDGGEGYHNLGDTFKKELGKLEECQREALRFWMENPRRYIWSKEEVLKVDKLRREMEIVGEFRKKIID